MFRAGPAVSSGEHEDLSAAGRTGHENIHFGISDDIGALKVDPEPLDGFPDHAGMGFPADAVPVGMMRAVIDGVDFSARAAYFREHPPADFIQLRFRHDPPSHARLIGNDHQCHLMAAECPNCLKGTRDEPEFFPPRNVTVFGRFIDDAVSVDKNSRFLISSFGRQEFPRLWPI